MENISEALGTLEIQANSYVEIEELKKYFEITKNWTYNISCKDLNDKVFLRSSYKDILHGYLPYYIICNFKGSGHGSFSITITKLQEWLEKEIINNKLLKDSEFKIIFKYVDLSSKQNFINDEKRMLIHASGGFHQDCTYEFKYDYTLVNKADILGMHLEEVIADEFKDKNDIEIFSILNKERKQIEEYTEKLLEVYLYENGFDHYAEICDENPFEESFA